jgi:hypothetical protein
MATASTRPDWALEVDQVDIGQDVDAQLTADIEAVMAARVNPALKFAKGTFDPGTAASWNGSEDGISPSASTPVTGTDPNGQPTDADTPVGTDAAPVGKAGGAVAVAPGDIPLDGAPGELAPPEPGTPPTTPETFNVVLPTGDTFNMNNEQANYLLQLHNWVQSVDPTVKDQWAQIEQGQATAVPLSDYEQYKAWKAAGAPASPVTPPTAPAVPERPYSYDPALVDAPTAEYIARLEAAARTATPPATAQQPTIDTPQVQQAISQSDIDFRVQAEANRRVQTNAALDSATQAIVTQYGLTPEQAVHLQTVTPALNIIPAIVERKRVYSPTGTVVSDAPLGEVFKEAFETAMAMDPTLRVVKDNHNLQAYLAANNAQLSAVNTKKANAGSLATAPSAAVPGREVDMSKMNKGQRDQYVREQMTAELAAAMNGE